MLGFCLSRVSWGIFLYSNHLAKEERAGCVTLILCCGCVICLFLTAPCAGLQSVNVAFPGHTYLSCGLKKHLDLHGSNCLPREVCTALCEIR